jgi:hypothetical protein
MIPSVYKGLKWTNMSYMHESHAVKNFPKSGYVTSFIPAGSLHIAFFKEVASISTKSSDEAFALVSLTACAAWNDDLQLTITAYRNSIQVNNHNIILLFGRPQRIFLRWKNIDKVTFKSSGGIAHSASGASAGTQIAITQLTTSDLADRKMIL